MEEPQKDSIQELQEKCDQYLAGWQRAKADLINFQKEEERRFETTILYSSSQIIKEFLPTLDSLGFALESTKENEAAQKGIATIKSQFVDALTKMGVKEIPVKKGDEFDPTKHEAMMQVPLSEEEKDLDNKVVEVLVPGYTTASQVLRATKVKVGMFTENNN